MQAFSYDLHVHSCLSPCGDDDMTPCNIAGMAYLNGLKIVALTDHNTCQNCPAFFTKCEQYSIVPVAGMELTTAEEVHLVCLFEKLDSALAFEAAIRPRRMPVENRVDIFGNQLIMGEEDIVIGKEPYYLPAATSIPIAEAAALVAEFDGICYPAHIDRQSNGILAVLGDFPPYPEFGLAELNDAQHRELAGSRKIIVSSDAHRLWEISDSVNFLHLDAALDADAETIRAALFGELKRRA